MKILVTGGAGFIGSNFIHYWLNKYPLDEIINIDKLTYAGHLSSLQDIESNSNYSFKNVDINEFEEVNKIVATIDLIIHFAAESHVDRSISGPKEFVLTNVLGTQNLLEAARLNGNIRFHHISTDEVFGSLSNNLNDVFTEQTPYSPHSPYSASKASSDHFVRAYHDTYGLPITITNCSNNYGPYQYIEKLIPLTITRLLKGQNVSIYGNGLNIRDWLHVEDHCIAIDTVIKKGRIGETYCIGGNSEKTNLEVVKTILNILNLPQSRIEYIADRAGHDLRYAIDHSKVSNELGWYPLLSFEEGIKQTITWYTQNETWWEEFI